MVRRHTAATFGAQVLRYSSFGWLALALGQLAGLASVLVVVRFLAPSDFGRLSLLYFFAALVSFVIGLGTNAGTMWRVFGASDDDADDSDSDDSDSAGPASPEKSTRRSLGTGISLSLLLSVLALGLVLPVSGPIGEALLKVDDPTVVVLATVSGGFGALYHLVAAVLWMERRPRAFLRLSAAHPVLVVAAVVPLVAAGGGLVGAIAGTALGTAVSAAVGTLAIRSSFTAGFDRGEAIAILRRGPARFPIVGSYWVIDQMSVFLLSRFVAPAELGVFHLAARIAMGAVLLGGGIRLALRPLMRTTLFGAVEEEHGAPVARGVVLAYVTLTMIGVTLVAALFGPLLVRLGPPSYDEAARLIGLIACAQAAAIVFRVLYKAAKFPRKRRAYVACVVTAAITFVGAALLLVPLLGLEGAPAAVLVAFAGPAAYLLWRSQSGRQPLALPYRPLALAALAALGCALVNQALAPRDALAEAGVALALIELWVAMVILVEAVPRHHYRLLIEAARGTIKAAGSGPDAGRALGNLTQDERVTLRALLIHRPVDSRERLVHLLRQATDQRSGSPTSSTEDDRRIAEYLLSPDSRAARDSSARALLASGSVAARQLHELETVMETLLRAPVAIWADDSAPPRPAREDPGSSLPA